MHLKYAEMLAIVVHENMKLGDNTPEWREALTISDKNLTNCSYYFTALIVINNLETQRSYKTTINLENLKFFKKKQNKKKQNKKQKKKQNIYIYIYIYIYI